MDDVIIKKVKKVAGHGHHGGAWKVAYADFVTAMMTFFLLLWLLNATTEVQKQGIADYFSPISVSRNTGGAGGMLGGRAMSSPGSMMTRTAVPAVSIKLEPTTGVTKGDAEEEGGANDGEKTAEMDVADEASKDLKRSGGNTDEELKEKNKEFIAKLRKAEENTFDHVEREIRETIERTPDLQGMERHLLIDKTPEGLRIQVIDREGRPMFKTGSSSMVKRTRLLLSQIGKTLSPLPNRIKIAGHTDAIPYRRSRTGYRNWELSSDRAQASRRILSANGLALDRIAAVEGRASQDPLLPENPTSARNRRITLMLLRVIPPKGSRAPLTEEIREKLKAETAKKEQAAKKSNKPSKSKAATKDAAPLKLDWTGPRVR